MKIIVTGSLGHVSKPLTQELIQKGHAVTVISTSPDRKAGIEALGAKAAIGSVRDVSFLETSFAGSDAAYLMIPPSYNEADFMAYCRMLGTNYTQAIRKAGIKRVVHLSSWGAHRSSGTGPIVGSHIMETILDTIPDITLTHLRATSFFTNLYSFVGMIREAGIIGASYGGEDRIVLAHPTDIAAAAAEELTAGASTSNGPAIRYVASDDRTCNEIARILGNAIGKPDLKWLTFTDDQTREALLKRGMPAGLAASLVELGNAMHTRKLHEDYDKHKPAVMGKIKTEDFAREFAAKF